MEYHPSALSLLLDFKTSSTKTLPVGILIFLIDSKTKIDYKFMYNFTYAFKKGAIKSMRKFKIEINEMIAEHFQYCIFGVRNNKITQLEILHPFSYFTMQENSFGMFLFNDDNLIEKYTNNHKILKRLLIQRDKNKQMNLKKYLNKMPIAHVKSNELACFKENHAGKSIKLNKQINCNSIDDESIKKIENKNSILTRKNIFSQMKTKRKKIQIMIPIKRNNTINLSSKTRNDEIISKLRYNQPFLRKERMQELIKFKKNSLSKFIKKITIQKSEDEVNEKFKGITFPDNAIVWNPNKSVKSLRSFQKHEKLTYIKFHDTIRPALHVKHEKYSTKISIQRIPLILNYDDDSDPFWNEDEDGESINYATETEEEYSESSCEYSWIDDDEPENLTKKKNLKFQLIQPKYTIYFQKDQNKYNFLD